MCGCRPSSDVRRVLCDFASFTTDHVLFGAAGNFSVPRRPMASSGRPYLALCVVTARLVVTSAQASPGVLLPQCGECHATPGSVRIRVAHAGESHLPQEPHRESRSRSNPPTPRKRSGCNRRKWSKPEELRVPRRTLRLQPEEERRRGKPSDSTQTLRLQPEEVVETGGTTRAPANPPTPTGGRTPARQTLRLHANAPVATGGVVETGGTAIRSERLGRQARPAR